jgi:hypothetical protein
MWHVWYCAVFILAVLRSVGGVTDTVDVDVSCVSAVSSVSLVSLPTVRRANQRKKKEVTYQSSVINN